MTGVIVKIILFVLFTLHATIYPQFGIDGKPRLLFNVDGSLKNPSFFIQKSEYNYNPNSLIFELHQDSVSDVYLSYYSATGDSFLTPFPITFNNHLNINPCGISTFSQKIIFFQTNAKGNWDIAYAENKNGIWDSIKIIADSSADDINPSVVKPIYYLTKNVVSIVYQKNNSIFMFSKSDTSETNGALLKENDSTKYSNPAAFYSSIYINKILTPVLVTAAIAVGNSQNKKLIENIRSLNNNNYDTTFVITEGDVSNPEYLMNFKEGITYDKITNGFTSVYFYDKSNNTGSKLALNDTLFGSFSNLQTENYIRILVGKIPAKTSSIISYYPYVYNFQRNDSSFLCIGNDTLICSKIKNLKSAIEFITYYNKKDINYAVWEDSVNGSIKLKGLRINLPLPSSINDKIIASNFILYQNYPNPFNPTTTIKYQIPKSGLVQLKVYDILGREVATLVNEFKTAGEHSVQFVSSNFGLASGVYFYHIQAGQYSVIKKLLLLK